MPAPLTTHRRKLQRFREVLDEYHALIVLSRQFNAGVKRDRERLLGQIESLTNAEIDANAALYTDRVDALRKLLGATQPGKEYIRLVNRLDPTAAEYVFAPKWLLKQFFRKIEEFLPGLVDLPEHTRLSFDVAGNQGSGKPGELRIIEAALYEDMCAMFNLAWRLIPLCSGPNAAKPNIKASAAARRGAILASFYFVEAYLNSIAFDHVVNNESRLSKEDLAKLTEWDAEKKRERLVSFRDKLLGYPRIILGVTHPVLQENNSKAIAYMLGPAKDFRDAIVHANPRPEPETWDFDKEISFWVAGSCTPLFSVAAPTDSRDTTRAWIETVDNAIAVVQQLENAPGPLTPAAILVDFSPG